MTTATTKPPRLPIPDAFQMTLSLMQGGQPAAIVLGARNTALWEIDAAALAAWRDAAWAAFRTIATSEVTCTGAVGRSLRDLTNPTVVEVGAATAGAGTLSGQSVAAGATLIKWTTATGGRSGKGRTFIPGLSANYLATGGRGYSATYGSLVTTAIGNYLADAGLSSQGLKPCVLSFRKGAAYVITGGSLAPVVGIQRRRMRA